MNEGKKESFRFIYFGFDRFSAAKNMAIDEALEKQSSEAKNAYIRFYDFEKPSVILSYSDSKRCLRSEAFDEKSIEISRRQSGGKPIYVDDNVLAYSIISPLSDSNKEFESTTRIHHYFGSRIIKAINAFTNIGSDRVSLGNVYSIRIDGRPIAGHAQSHTLSRSFFYHGVLAIGKWDAERINKFLDIRREDYDDLKSSPCIRDLLESKDHIDIIAVKRTLSST